MTHTRQYNEQIIPAVEEKKKKRQIPDKFTVYKTLHTSLGVWPA